MAIHQSVQAPIGHVERGATDPPRPQRRRRGRTLGIDEGLMGVALLAGPANVIMQLAQPGVGYGVMESRVESGRVDLHPFKRARTTFTYLAVATNGSDAQKAAFRRAVNKAHAQVYSTPESPVSYNAFDPALQLWVGACLYKGGLDIYRMFIGELDGEDAERHYREGMALAKVHIDDAVREYLYPIAANRIRGVKLPGPIQRLSEGFALMITTGFLPQRFRDEMRLPWDATKQRRFDRLIAVLATVNRYLPRFIRQFPFNVLLHDLDRRIKKGRPLV